MFIKASATFEIFVEFVSIFFPLPMSDEPSIGVSKFIEFLSDLYKFQVFLIRNELFVLTAGIFYYLVIAKGKTFATSGQFYPDLMAIHKGEY